MPQYREDKTWNVNINVRVTTMCGWKPGEYDIRGWLEDGSSLELISVETVEEEKTNA